MKKKPGTKLAIALAIMQHPAVQVAAKKIGKAGLRKAQAWWEARKAPERAALEKPKAAKKARSPRKRKPAAARPAAEEVAKKTARKRKPAPRVNPPAG